MSSRATFVAIASAITAIALATQTGYAAGEIGNVRLVKVWAYGTPPQAQRAPLYRADDLFADELVETVENGALHIRFLDDTRLRLGSSSRVTLDSFVYDPSTNAGEMVADLGEGVFRFITGKLNKEGFQVRTPVAVIGVRGTDFTVGVGADGTTVVAVAEGSVVVTATVGAGGSASVGAGQVATADVTGQVNVGVGQTPDDAALNENAGIGSPDDAGIGGGGQGQDDAGEPQ